MKASVLVIAACGSPRATETTNIANATPDPSMPKLAVLLRVPEDPPVLPAEVEGLVYSDGIEPWGLAFDDWDARQSRMPREPLLGKDPPRATYEMSVLGSPYSVYFRSTGDGIQFERNIYFDLPGGENTQYDVARYSPIVANPFGLRESAHLVAMEVNDRRGGAGGRFVATKVRVLDGEYGVSPTKLIVALRARFDAAVATRNEAMHAALDDGKRQLTAVIESQPITKSVAIWPTWDTRDRTLRVVFVVEWLRGKTSECRNGAGDPTLFALKVRCEPGGTRLSYGAAMAAVYRVDASGKILEEMVYAPMGYTGDLSEQQRL